MARMLLFAELVQDTHRNQGNIVYTGDWTLHMIDFSRAFRTDRDLQRPDDLIRCETIDDIRAPSTLTPLAERDTC